MFLIEDDLHAEQIGEFKTKDEAIIELQRLAELPWNEAPNICSCTNWRACGRHYHLIEYDTSSTPWTALSDIPMLEVSAERTAWLSDSRR